MQEADELQEHAKRHRIVERQDEYHRRMYKDMMISPARVDPFADGKGSSCCTYSFFFVFLVDCGAGLLGWDIE